MYTWLSNEVAEILRNEDEEFDWFRILSKKWMNERTIEQLSLHKNYRRRTTAFFFSFRRRKKEKEKYLSSSTSNTRVCLKWDKIIPRCVFLHIMFVRYDKLRATLYIRPPRWISIRITATVGRWDLGLFLQPSPSPAFPAWVNNSQRHEENVAPLW